MNEVADHVRHAIFELGQARGFRFIAVDFYDHRRRMEVFVRQECDGDERRLPVHSFIAGSDRTIFDAASSEQALEKIREQLRAKFSLTISAAEEFENIVAILNSTDEPPKVVRKETGAVIGGNSPSAANVFVDPHGRLWREDKNSLALIR